MASEAAASSSSASADGTSNAGTSYRRSNRIEQLDGSNTVTLVSMDGDSFVVHSSAVVVSKLLDAMVEGPGGQAKEIPLPNMRSSVVAKMVEFCQHNRTEPMKKIPQPIPHGKAVSDYVQEWFSAFVQGLGDELLLAANYLDLPPLLELCAATIGLRMMNADKTPDEVKREFNIKEPFPPEVERTLREENKWSTEPPIGS